MKLENYVDLMLPAIEEELFKTVGWVKNFDSGDLYDLLTYHMGWSGDNDLPAAKGKRIRPLMVALCTDAAGGDWRHALPAAAGVELIHNFSLIHDDIEDNSPLRRGRPTLWKKWNIPLAINAGDAMFTLAHLAVLQLENITSSTIALQAVRLLHETCLRLTSGQHLDISYESRDVLEIEAYWPMVQGKTAALLAASTELGSVVAGCDRDTRATYREFGYSLGLAFQALDDLLGIWGDSALTGKSAESDLITRKKSLPVLYGLSVNSQFATRWKQGSIGIMDLREVASLLEEEGAREYTQKIADQYTTQALNLLSAARLEPQAGAAIQELAHQLLRRRS